MRKLIKNLFTLVFVLLPIQMMADEKKVALVIGNAEYAESSNVRPLLCPKNDAKAMADKLKSLGFNISTGSPILNGTRDEMLDAIETFADDAKYADVAVVYYSGHAVSYKNKSYMMPIGKEFTNNTFSARCIEVELILDALESIDHSEEKVKILFLDACRNNPFTSYGKDMAEDHNKGLVRVNAPKGTMVCYATQPGQTAKDGNTNYSPFTKAILQEIDKENVPINNFLAVVQRRVLDETKTQKPSYVGNIEHEFCFNKTSVINKNITTSEDDVLFAQAFSIEQYEQLAQRNFVKAFAPLAKLYLNMAGKIGYEKANFYATKAINANVDVDAAKAIVYQLEIRGYYENRDNINPLKR